MAAYVDGGGGVVTSDGNWAGAVPGVGSVSSEGGVAELVDRLAGRRMLRLQRSWTGHRRSCRRPSCHRGPFGGRPSAMARLAGGPLDGGGASPVQRRRPAARARRPSARRRPRRGRRRTARRFQPPSRWRRRGRRRDRGADAPRGGASPSPTISGSLSPRHARRCGVGVASTVARTDAPQALQNRASGASGSSHSPQTRPGLTSWRLGRPPIASSAASSTPRCSWVRSIDDQHGRDDEAPGEADGGAGRAVEELGQ